MERRLAIASAKDILSKVMLGDGVVEVNDLLVVVVMSCVVGWEWKGEVRAEEGEVVAVRKGLYIWPTKRDARGSILLWTCSSGGANAIILSSAGEGMASKASDSSSATTAEETTTTTAVGLVARRRFARGCMVAWPRVKPTRTWSLREISRANRWTGRFGRARLLSNPLGYDMHKKYFEGCAALTQLVHGGIHPGFASGRISQERRG